MIKPPPYDGACIRLIENGKKNEFSHHVHLHLVLLEGISVNESHFHSEPIIYLVSDVQNVK